MRPFCFIAMKKLLRSSVTHLAVGLLLVGIGGGLFWLRASNLSQNDQPIAPPASAVQWVATSPAVITGSPVNLTLPSLHLSLSVISGVYDPISKSWTLTNNKVQYATITPPPNNANGNTFIYGHALWNLFASLPSIKPGAQAVITTDNGHTFTYTFVSSRVTDPSDTSLFNYTGAPILTLQTCTGLFYQYRQLFTFRLDKAV